MKSALQSSGLGLVAESPSPARPDAIWRALHADASDAYRAAGRYAWHFARGKLGGDPAFRGLLESGEIPPGARVVDVGCGQGLLASLLRSADRFDAEGRWPAAWPTAPSGTHYTGVEMFAPDVRRAESALGTPPSASRSTARFVCADMTTTELPGCDVAVLLDVLHYVDPTAQERVLREAHRALRPGGRLLLRVGDASQRRAQAITRWIDGAVALWRTGRVAPIHMRPLAVWTALLQSIGFEVRSLPMSRGTPFANVLLVAEKVVERGASA
jgi:SAM-dependent methyltransferase